MPKQDELLKILEAHGQQFIKSFNIDIPTLEKRSFGREPGASPAKRRRVSKVDEEEEEEWRGIQHSESESSEGYDSKEDFAEIDSDFELEDDDLTTASATTKDDKVVVFSENSFKKPKADPVSKSQLKALMSSKVSKLRNDESSTLQIKEKADDDNDERTNAENDALLHKLVHTQLLSGSLNPDLDMTPAHRRKALAGRVIELAGSAKLGKGERIVRETEKNRAGKHVREGLTRKQRETEKEKLEEAKHLGNYHPTLKRLYSAASVSSTPRSRARGLKLGVGRFRGGVLQLSQQDIASVTGRPQQPRGRQGRKRK